MGFNPPVHSLAEPCVESATGKELEEGAMPIRFGSWMGEIGMAIKCDRQITQRVLRICRWIAADLYWRELDALRAELSMGTASDELRAWWGMWKSPTEPFFGA